MSPSEVPPQSHPETPALVDVPPDAHQMQCMEVWGGNQHVSTAVAMPGLTAWVYSRPFGEGTDDQGVGGGDIHYLTSCATGRVTRMVVADVAGHGATVSRAADALRGLMRKYSNYIDQSSFVESLNRRFAELAEQVDVDAVAPGAFATAVVGTYFAPTDELVISNAGHPRPMLFRSREKAWSILMPRSSETGLSNLPLGIDTPTTYPTTRLALDPGDLVLFYSDSLIESRAAGGGPMLGERGLLDTLAGLEHEPSALVDALLARLSERAAATEFGDDVTALLISRNAAKPTPSIALSLAGAARLARHAIGSLGPGGLPLSLPELGLAALGGAAVKRLNRPQSTNR